MTMHLGFVICAHHIHQSSTSFEDIEEKLIFSFCVLKIYDIKTVIILIRCEPKIDYFRGCAP